MSKHTREVFQNSLRRLPKNALTLRNKRFNSVAQIFSNFCTAGSIALTTSALIALFVHTPTMNLESVVASNVLGFLALLAACAMQLIKRYPDEPE